MSRITKEVAMTRNLKFGVEIEFINGEVNDEIIRLAQTEGIRIINMGYTHEVTEGFWKLVRDGSCGYEIVSPILYGQEGLEQLRKVCDCMTRAGAKVDKRCGVHVHHDASDMTVDNFKNVYRIYYKYRNTIDSMMPLSRRASNNYYCQDIDSAWLERADGCNSIDDMIRVLADNSRRATPHRYHKINFCSYLGYKTLEFRHHSGSTDAEKLTNWVILTNMIMQRATGKAVKPRTEARARKWAESDVHMMYDFYIELGISGTELANYVRNRRNQFKELNEQMRVA